MSTKYCFFDINKSSTPKRSKFTITKSLKCYLFMCFTIQGTNTNKPTENVQPRRYMHHPDGKCTTPTEYAPSRRIMHHLDGKGTTPTENAPEEIQLSKSGGIISKSLSRLSRLISTYFNLFQLILTYFNLVSRLISCQST